MAKQLSMEDLIKKYQYLQSSRQDLAGTGKTTQNSRGKDRTFDVDSSMTVSTLLSQLSDRAEKIISIFYFV
jgi:hypothetical protein